MKKLIIVFISMFLILSGNIVVKAEELNEKIILIDPGHGGIDGGAISKNGTVEKEINLSIALKLRDSLEDNTIIRAFHTIIRIILIVLFLRDTAIIQMIL